MIGMKDDRVRIYLLGEKVEIDGIKNCESYKQACSSLKASKLTFATFNVQKGHSGTIW